MLGIFIFFFSFFELVENNETNWRTSTIFLFTTASSITTPLQHYLKIWRINRQRWIFFSPKIIFKQFFVGKPRDFRAIFLNKSPYTCCIHNIQVLYRISEQKIHCSFNDTAYLRIGIYIINNRIKLQLILVVTPPMVWLVVCAVFFLVLLVGYCTETGAVYKSGPHTRPGPNSLLYYVCIYSDVLLKSRTHGGTIKERIVVAVCIYVIRTTAWMYILPIISISRTQWCCVPKNYKSLLCLRISIAHSFFPVRRNILKSIRISNNNIPGYIINYIIIIYYIIINHYIII